MNSMKNRVTLIGNLGQDPETKAIEGGKKVVHFSLATKDGYKNGDGKRVEETTWHNITAWNGLADIAGKYLKKGSLVAVEGRLVYRNYDDKKGVTKYVTEVVLSDITLLPTGKGKNSEIKDTEE